MSQKIRVVHYLNQFFAQIGGEDKGDVGPAVKAGVIGAGRALQQALGEDGEVVATIYCGDNYFAEHQEQVIDELLQRIGRIQSRFVDRRPGVRERPLRHRLRRDLPGGAAAARHRQPLRAWTKTTSAPACIAKISTSSTPARPSRAWCRRFSAWPRSGIETRAPRSDRQTGGRRLSAARHQAQRIRRQAARRARRRYAARQTCAAKNSIPRSPRRNLPAANRPRRLAI